MAKDTYDPYNPTSGYLPGEPDPNASKGGYDYGKAQASWYNSAPGTSIDDWIKNNPEFTQGITSSHNGEYMNLPGGESFDAQRNFGVGQSTQWGSKDYDYATGRAYTPAEAAAAEAKWADANGVSNGGSGGSSTGGSTTTASTSGYGTTAQRDALYNTLLARSNQGLAVSPTDANIRQQADPYAAQVERSRRNYLADTAEKANPLANLQGEARVTAEKAGQANGLFESQLVGREMQAKRDEIAQALSGMQGMLSQEQQLAMQSQLAQLDAAIRNRQISSGNDQFTASLGLQSENQNNYWDALRSGLIK